MTRPWALSVFLVASAATLCFTVVSAANWAVLIAGSNGYYNYRHQADICHAYQLLHKNGIPDSNIIVMMYDDIANSAQNPKKGQIFNYPNGPDEYPGVLKDYTGNDVNAANFVKILTGQDMTGIGSGKTLKSTGNDNVLIYFADHGGTGLIAMPTGPYLYSHDLITALNTMHSKNMYKQLVFYMEACESGSMFNKLLPTNMNIYAVTAANPFQSSYACDYSNEVNAYLNDCWSINWMLDLQNSPDIHTETLNQQFDAVKNSTTESEECRYGDLTMGTEVLAEFFAGKTALRSNRARRAPQLHTPLAGVSMHDIPLHYFVHRAAAEPNEPYWAKHAQMEEARRNHADLVFGIMSTELLGAQYARALDEHHQESNAFLPAGEARSPVGATGHCSSNDIVDTVCLKGAVEGVEAACGRFSDYSLKYVRNLAEMCKSGRSVNEISSAASRVCVQAQ